MENDPSDAVVEKYLHQLKQGSRAALASAITLVETEHKLKKQLAKKLLAKILQEETGAHNQTSAKKQSFRIGALESYSLAKLPSLTLKQLGSS